MKKYLPGLVLLLWVSYSFGQNKILGIVGSSTAKGTGASTPANSWVNKVTAYYISQNILASTTNLAENGYDPYYAMPTGYVPPANRPNPDPNRNITKLLTFNPDVVIIAFASNNYPTYSFQEIHATLDTIYTRAILAGKKAYVATSQPRTGFTLAGRQKLRDVKDSIIKWFGSNSINFFDPVVEPSDLTIKAEYRYALDDIHLNDAGHAVLYDQVIAKNIFSSVLSSGLQNFHLKKVNSSRIEISWTSVSENQHTTYTVEKKSNEQSAFAPIHSIQGNGNKTYNYIDLNASGNGIQYRIKIQDGTTIKYSTIISVPGNTKGTMVQLRGNPALSSLNLLIDVEQDATSKIHIIDLQGRTLITQPVSLSAGTNSLTIPIAHLTRGQYISTLILDGMVYKNVFQKQ